VFTLTAAELAFTFVAAIMTTIVVVVRIVVDAFDEHTKE